MLGHLLITQRSEQPMAEPLKLYLDQMLRLDVAQALRDEGHDVMRASTQLNRPLRSRRKARQERHCDRRVSALTIDLHPSRVKKINATHRRNRIPSELECGSDEGWYQANGKQFEAVVARQGLLLFLIVRSDLKKQKYNLASFASRFKNSGIVPTSPITSPINART